MTRTRPAIRLVTGRAVALVAPLRHRDTRLVWAAQSCSDVGDWAARLALAVLVFARTRSGLLTVLVTATGLLPYLGFGTALATLADRYPRRRVMVVADLARAGLYLAMTAPLPPFALLTLCFLAGLAGPPFEASRAAMRPDLAVDEATFGAFLALTQLTGQLSVMVGYGAGGLLVAALGPRPVLALNALSFGVSAVLVSRTRVADRPVVVARAGAGRRLSAGARALWRDPVLRQGALLLAAFGSLTLVPEALVAVYAKGSGTGAGFLAGAAPLGAVVAGLVAPHHGSRLRLFRAAGLLSLTGAAVSTVGFAILHTPPWPAVGYLGLGIVSAVMVPIYPLISQALPRAGSASTFAVLQATVVATQAAAVVAGGALADAVGVTAVCVAAAVGALAVGGGVALAARRPATQVAPAGG